MEEVTSRHRFYSIGRTRMNTTTNTSILALDLGTVTGWALQQRDGTKTSGTQSFKPQRYEGGGMRYLRFKRWLNEFLAQGWGWGHAVHGRQRDAMRSMCSIE